MLLVDAVWIAYLVFGYLEGFVEIGNLKNILVIPFGIVLLGAVGVLISLPLRGLRSIFSMSEKVELEDKIKKYLSVGQSKNIEAELLYLTICTQTGSIIPMIGRRCFPMQGN